MPFLASDSKPLEPKTTPDIRSEPPSKAEIGSIVKTFQVLTSAAIGMSILLALLPATGHDQLWCLYVADRMLHGIRLYGPEILESNPPLIMWLLVPITALAQALHLPAATLFKAAVLVAMAISAATCLSLLRRTAHRFLPDRPLDPDQLRPAPTFGPALLWPLLFAFVVVFAVMPARDFGQRDHLLAIVCLPYLVAVSLELPRPDSGSLPTNSLRPFAGAMIGILAGLGIALKPHHALVPICVEILLILRRRSLRPLLRPEPWALLLTCVVYLLAIRLVTPTYLTAILPLPRSTYWAIGPLTLPALVGQAIQLHILLGITLVLFVVLRKYPEPTRPLTGVLLTAGIASTLAYYLQGTGWYYQQLPALSFFALALALELAPFVTRLRGPAMGRIPIAATALSVVALALTAHFMGYPFTADRSFPITSPDPAFFAQLSPGTPVAILTTMVDDSVPPIAKYHLLWAQRTNNLWILPAILRNEDPQTHRPLRRLPPALLASLDRDQHRYMTEDLEHWQPTLVLVQRCQDPAVHCQILEDRHDDLLAWFERDPAFRSLWLEHYRLLRRSGEFDAYMRQ